MTNTTSCGTEPCKKQACAIQDCLKKNGYDDQKCIEKIMRLYNCCFNYYKESGETKTICCPTIEKLHEKMLNLDIAKS
ncbi:Cmc4p SCDLUD_001183 [Saccharomycodes ludwigii]|uniref:Cmc4p n=1 Tax=Saccharomycodes ludwigii TaxID=36035 RepID=UPI001E8B7C35|nr:hypothetical protein SCDLUD_001183 [Saccharomycodes ludwigii]KAH3903541.1 hypothetical protein SCDLUD_001183 [Saccharomycodes ludwigii]